MKLRWNLIFYDFNNLLPKVLPSLLKNEQELGIIYQYCCHSVEDFGYDSILIFIYQWGFTPNQCLNLLWMSMTNRLNQAITMSLSK